MRFLAALQFLTIVPVPRRQVAAEEIGRSLGYFPLVGLLLGLFLAVLDWSLGLILPSALVNALLIVALVVLTGAMHLDGVIDTCDGLAGHRTPEARRELMRDSRAGGFGVIGAVCLLLLKYASLVSLPQASRVAALVLMPVLGRWAMVYSVFAYPYAQREGLGRVFKEQASWPGVIAATAITLGLCLGLMRLMGLAVMLGVWLIVVGLACYFRGRFAGLTGDTYGAINEAAEVSTLIFVVLTAGWGAG